MGSPILPPRSKLTTAASHTVRAGDVQACLTNVPFDSKDASDNLEEITKFAQIISTQAFYKDPPNPHLDTVPIDLQGRLAVIKAKAGKKDGYPNYYEFHRELITLFGSFNDGHIAFRPTCSYAFGDFYHDHPIISIAKDLLSPPDIHLIDPKTHEIGEIVKKIDGKDAYDYLHDLVHNEPDLLWTDPDSRYNYLMARKSSEEFDRGTFAQRRLFSEDFEMETESGKKIMVEWKVELRQGRFRGGFKDTESFTRVVCRGDRDAVVPIEEGGLEVGFGRPGPPSTFPLNGGHFPDVPPAEPTFPKPLLRTNQSEITYHQLDAETAVICFHFFKYFKYFANTYPITFYDKWIGEHWVETMLKIKQEMKSKNIQRVILDTSNNNGGWSSLAFLTFRHFFPKNVPYYGVNFRYSDLGKLNFGKYMNHELDVTRKTDLTQFQDVNELFEPPVSFYGDKFSQRARFDPGRMIGRELRNSTRDPELEQKLDQEDTFEPSDIIILTDGLCASACGSFAEAMRDAGVRSIVVGGRPYKDAKKVPSMQAIGGVKGLEVADLDAVIQKLEDKRASYPDVIPEKPSMAMSMTGTFRNSFAPEGEYPLEFVYRPAAFRIQMTPESWKDRMKLWQDVRTTAWDAEGDMNEAMFDSEKTERLHDEAEDSRREEVRKGKGGVSGVYTGSKKLAWHILDGMNLPH